MKRRKSDGIQDFPPEMNYANEIHRFGRAGELYTQKNFNPQKLSKLLEDMGRITRCGWRRCWSSGARAASSAPATTPATSISPWQKSVHGLRDGEKGPQRHRGTENSKFLLRVSVPLWPIYLQQEAGFHPLEVLRHATVNGAKVIGMEDKLGRVRQGFIADLLVVNGNPLDDLRLMNPYGTDLMTLNGKVVNNFSGDVMPGDPKVKMVHGGGIAKGGTRRYNAPRFAMTTHDSRRNTSVSGDACRWCSA